MSKKSSAQGYLDMELLRFTTAGSVDDGKSTLIGRLLYDSKAVFEDQIEHIEEISRRSGEDSVNLALLTDGLRAEREQGITIDVAYRYFATPLRKFIIADTPGHIQYTRNMVTGASTADAAIILIDARHGVIEQTKRHTYIASLLGISNIIVAVNKMDLVEFNQERFSTICKDFEAMRKTLSFEACYFVPLSAKFGDNVVEHSTNLTWYEGETLLHLLETLPTEKKFSDTAARLAVQYVVRPQNDQFHDYRGYAGRVTGGTFRKGDRVVALPSGIHSVIASIDTLDGELSEASHGKSVTITLEDDIDIGRGDILAAAVGRCLQESREIEATVCWLNRTALQTRKKYILRQATAELSCMITQVNHVLNIHTLEKLSDKKEVEINDIASISLKTSSPLLYDSYKENRVMGSFILIDEATNETVGACMIS